MQLHSYINLTLDDIVSFITSQRVKGFNLGDFYRTAKVKITPGFTSLKSSSAVKSTKSIKLE